jgi:hypothetical protein
MPGRITHASPEDEMNDGTEGTRRVRRPELRQAGIEPAAACAAVSPGLAAGQQVSPAAAGRGTGGIRVEVVLAVVAFGVLCVAVLSAAPRLVEPDDYAYRASIVAVTDGHFLTLSTAQVYALAAQLARSAGSGLRVRTGPGPFGGSIEQWVQLSGPSTAC